MFQSRVSLHSLDSEVLFSLQASKALRKHPPVVCSAWICAACGPVVFDGHFLRRVYDGESSFGCRLAPETYEWGSGRGALSTETPI